METTNRGSQQNAAEQHDWRNAENAALPKEAITDEKNEGFSGETTRETAYEESDEHLHAMAVYDDPEDDEDDEEEEGNDDEGRDWGHVDPAENNGPFPDPNEPSFPGSGI